jgi:mannose-1-phosphate guanylyltransferase/mannose-6-phosphate isomerase
MQPDIVPVILAGGEGRRLRPLTSPTRPKPFLKIFNGLSLLQMTLQRADSFLPPIIVCDGRFASEADKEAAEIGFAQSCIIAEPVQRGTAAAIACTAFLLQHQNPFMLVMPSDHVVTNPAIFEKTVRKAAAFAPDDAPVILGVRPEGASQRYGYIHTKPESADAFALESFTEKPPSKAARVMARNPGVFWNTGIFLCRAETLLRLLAIHAPDIFEAAGHAMAAAKAEGNIIAPPMSRYAVIPRLSIDHALMERLDSGLVLPLETGWHDVGCWERLLALKLGSMTRSLDISTRHERRRQDQP